MRELTVASEAFAWLAWYWAVVALTYVVPAPAPQRDPTIAEYVWGTHEDA